MAERNLSFPDSTVVTFEKSDERYTLAEWKAKLDELVANTNLLRNTALDVRYSSQQLRNESHIKSKWNKYFNDSLLDKRILEVSRWRDLLLEVLAFVDKQMHNLKMEKSKTERLMEIMYGTILITSQSLTKRDRRQFTEVTFGFADTALKKELCVIEGIKKHLVEKCEIAWKKLNDLEKLRFHLILDINDKFEAIEVDQELEMDTTSGGLTFKLDPSTILAKSKTYDEWLANCQSYMAWFIKEMTGVRELISNIFTTRHRCQNQLSAVIEETDLTIRKRIYEIQRARNELQWTLKNMKEQLKLVGDEIKMLKKAYSDNQILLKLAETRMQHRNYRPGFELVIDDVLVGLREEIETLKDLSAAIIEKLNCVKTIHYQLENDIAAVERDIVLKQDAHDIDIRNLNLRSSMDTWGVVRDAAVLTIKSLEKEVPEFVEYKYF